MNKTHALVWNEDRQRWNVAPETARRRGKRGGGRRGSVAALALIGLAGWSAAQAAPVGGTIAAGNGAGVIVTSPDQKQVSISQQTQKLIVDWRGFNIGVGERVTFNQPGASAIALNKVNGLSPSSILGKLDANGQVFLVNPNGIVFGRGAEVNVGGLVASTKRISDADFNAGNYRFNDVSNASVLNNGVIRARDRGYVALLGAQVNNQGEIHARLGRVALAAGDDFTVNFDGNGLLDLRVNRAALAALAENSGLLKADGGQVLMTARGAGSTLQTVVNNQGIIEAKSLLGQDGRIMLDGGSVGGVVVAGKLDASGSTSGGGVTSVTTQGQQVNVSLGTEVDTRDANGGAGTWWIRSSNIKVGANGVDADATVYAETLSQNLNTTNIDMRSSQGDVVVDAPIAWSSSRDLVLLADRNLVVNGSLTASGQDASLTLQAAKEIMVNNNIAMTGGGAVLNLDSRGGLALGDSGVITLSGANPTYRVNGQLSTVIQNVRQLQEIDRRPFGQYVLGNDLTGGSLTPIGEGGSRFSGGFDGLGNKLSGLQVRASGPNAGLFAELSGSIVNLKLEAIEVTPPSGSLQPVSIGALVGRNFGRIENVSTDQIFVSGSGFYRNVVGGLVGTNAGGQIVQGTVRGFVVAGAGTVAIGGLAGENQNFASNSGTIRNSVSHAAVLGPIPRDELGGMGGMGGLVGVNSGLIRDSSSHGSTQANGFDHAVGGLVGANLVGAEILRSSADGLVQGGDYSRVGGLVGENRALAVVRESSSAAVVNAGSNAMLGGIVGLNQGQVFNSSASGEVKFDDSLDQLYGGLAGVNYGLLRGNHTSGLASQVPLVGLNNGVIEPGEEDLSGDARGRAGGLRETRK